MARVPDYPGRDASNDCEGRNILCDYRACPDQGPFADRSAAHQGRVRTDRGAMPDTSRLQHPVLCPLRLTGIGGGPRKPVVCEHYTMAAEYLVGNRDSFADEGVRR